MTFAFPRPLARITNPSPATDIPDPRVSPPPPLHLVAVGVALHRELPVRRLDVRFGRRLGHPQHLVEAGGGAGAGDRIHRTS